jgi:WD40 repeat protein
VVAGGHLGQLSVWAWADFCRGGGGASGSGEGEESRYDPEDDIVFPLISCRPLRGWICDVRLVRDPLALANSSNSNGGGGAANNSKEGEAAAAGAAAGAAGTGLLVGASNDAIVSVWDLKRQHKGSPACLYENRKGLHSNGIYSLDLATIPGGGAAPRNLVLTTSKDGNAVLTEMAGDGSLRHVRTWEDVHDGCVVKKGRFRPASSCSTTSAAAAGGGPGDIAATCGVNGEVCLLDIRSGAVAARWDAHPNSTNFAEWSPRDGNQLVSSSFEPVVKVWDVRNTAAPLATFQGHTARTNGPSKGMFRAFYTGAGRYIATPGEGSRALSLYALDYSGAAAAGEDKVTGGRTVSRGALGFDPSCAFSVDGGVGEGAAVLLGTPKQVHVCRAAFGG